MKRIIKGDKVRVISGKFKGIEGNVLKVFPKNEHVLVEGVNKMKHHEKPKNQEEEGGIVEKECSIHLSKVTLIDLKQKIGSTKIAYTMDKNNKKQRVNRRNNAPITKAK